MMKSRQWWRTKQTSPGITVQSAPSLSSSGGRRIEVQGANVQELFANCSITIDKRQMSTALPSHQAEASHDPINHSYEAESSSAEERGAIVEAEVPYYVREFSNASDKHNKALIDQRDNYGCRDEDRNIPVVNPRSKLSRSSTYYLDGSLTASQTLQDTTTTEDLDNLSASTFSSDKNLNYSSLKTYITESSATRIAIAGEMGSGKSTILKRLAEDFTSSKCRRNVIVFRYFSSFSGSKETCPCEMLFGGLGSDWFIEQDTYKWLLKHQKNIIFFFDGLDQAEWRISGGQDICPYNKGLSQVIMSNIFKRTLFPDSKVVFTSRAYSIVNLHGKFRPDVVITLTGLSGSDSKLLFTSLIGEKGEEVWSKLSAQPNSIIPVLSNPAFLRFTVYAHQDQPPKNVTDIMQNLIQVFKRSSHIGTTHSEKILFFLRKLAHRGMVKNRAKYDDDDFKDIELTESEISSLVTTTPTTNFSNQCLLKCDRVHFFPHQSIQDFLVAEHISYTDLSSFKEAVQRHLTDDRWFGVMRFVAGIILNTNAADSSTRDLSQKRVIFKKQILQHITGAPLQFYFVLAESDHAELIEKFMCNKVDLSFFTTKNKSSHLDISGYDIGISGCAELGALVRYCSTSRVVMVKCHLTDKSLHAFLSTARGAKLSYLNVSSNHLTQNACDRIRLSISVEKLITGIQINPGHAFLEDNSNFGSLFQ